MAENVSESGESSNDAYNESTIRVLNDVEHVRTRPGMLPAIKMTEPYSPSVRASASAKPVKKAGATNGKVMRRKIVSGDAPSESA